VPLKLPEMLAITVALAKLSFAGGTKDGRSFGVSSSTASAFGRDALEMACALASHANTITLNDASKIGVKAFFKQDGYFMSGLLRLELG
jgi:hypothetical protein